MALHESFGHLKHKLWSKEGPRVKLPVWLPITKSRELTRPRCVQVECDTPLESLKENYEFASDLIPIGGLSKELWASKVPGFQTGTISRLPLWSPGTNSHLDVAPVEWRKVYYMGEGGDFPRIRAVVSQVSLVLLVACPSTKGAPECELTNLLVGLMQVRVSE
jgi:hypothetical protein